MSGKGKEREHFARDNREPRALTGLSVTSNEHMVSVSDHSVTSSALAGILFSGGEEAVRSSVSYRLAGGCHSWKGRQQSATNRNDGEFIAGHTPVI
jgi:hypothetical protein